MEEHYDIRFNRTEPSSDDIAAHQDFGALMAALEEDANEKEAVVVPMRSNRRPYLAIAAAVVFLIAAYPVYKSIITPTAVDETTYFAALPYVNPPATANVPDEVAKVVVDPTTEQQIPLEDGKIVISSTTFMNNRGKAIKQPVQVHYRQMDEVADYFMAGVPLQFQENDKLTQLDAAVILDVYATAAGEPLAIEEGQSVAVELNTIINNDGTEYQLYQLDTNNRRWVVAGPLADRQVANAQGWPENSSIVKRYQEVERQYDLRIAAAQAEATSSLPERPTPPKRSASTNPTLELDFLNQISLASGSTVSPEDLQKINQGGIWELLPESGNIDLNAFNVVWNNVKLRGLENDKFELTLINPQKEERLIVRPIMLDDSDFLKAQERYEAELATYEQAVANNAELQNDTNIELLKTEKDAALASLEQEIMASVEAMSAAEQLRLQQRSASFKFAISSWGIYAVAKRIQDLPQLSSISFQEQQAIEDVRNAQVFYTTTAHKTLYRGLIRDESARIPLAEKSESARIWIVNEQGELVVAQIPQTTSPLPAATNSIELNTTNAEPLPNSAALLRQKLVLQ